ncbi:MAG: NAD(P)H-dependent oxidoreductase [Rhodospirillales bacterium]|nr:NAD(P)H-dependent oxidoreductase [Rhodospirillales bacterium]
MEAVLAALDERTDASIHLIDLSETGPTLLSALTRSAVPRLGEAILERIESADLLVVGTPVYRASYTGALKHVFDLLRQDALSGKPAILAATGGSPLHGLVTEHQLRPLLGFFGAHTAPTAIYATEADFAGYVVATAALQQRIQRAATEGVSLLSLTRTAQEPAAQATNGALRTSTG